MEEKEGKKREECQPRVQGPTMSFTSFKLIFVACS